MCQALKAKALTRFVNHIKDLKEYIKEFYFIDFKERAGILYESALEEH